MLTWLKTFYSDPRRVMLTTLVLFVATLATGTGIFISQYEAKQPPRWLWQVVAKYDAKLGPAAGLGKIQIGLSCEAWRENPVFAGRVLPSYATFEFDLNLRTGVLRLSKETLPTDPAFRCPDAVAQLQPQSPPAVAPKPPEPQQKPKGKP